LIKAPYGCGYPRDDILRLFWFTNWLLELPMELADKIWRELRSYEEAGKMAYITSVERIGIKKGIEQGIQQGIRQGESTVLRRLLRRRFGPLPDWAERRLSEAAPAKLERWIDGLLDPDTLEDALTDDD
jgi:hypothetical protein